GLHASARVQIEPSSVIAGINPAPTSSLSFLVAILEAKLSTALILDVTALHFKPKETEKISKACSLLYADVFHSIPWSVPTAGSDLFSSSAGISLGVDDRQNCYSLQRGRGAASRGPLPLGAGHSRAAISGYRCLPDIQKGLIGSTTIGT